MRSSTIPSTISSGTSSPRSISGLALLPEFGVAMDMVAKHVTGRQVRQVIPLRNALSLRPLAGPRRAQQDYRTPQSLQIRLRAPRSAVTAATQLPLLHKTFVVPHHQLGLDLLHRIHRHADHDQ